MSVRNRVLDFFVYQLAALCPGWPVVAAHQDDPVEFNAYMVVDLQTERDIGNQERWNIDAETISVCGLREATLNIQALGTGSVEMLATLPAQLERPSVVDKFYVANISVLSAESVVDLTGLLDDSRYQERASIDLTVSYDRAAIDDPGWFNRVEITGVLGYGREQSPETKGMPVTVKIKMEKEIEDGKY
mgnify:CR=1 FL=1